MAIHHTYCLMILNVSEGSNYDWAPLGDFKHFIFVYDGVNEAPEKKIVLNRKVHTDIGT